MNDLEKRLRDEAPAQLPALAQLLTEAADALSQWANADRIYEENAEFQRQAIERLTEDKDAYVRLADAALEDRTVLRDRYEDLEKAALALRDKQRDYMSHRGDEVRGQAVAVAAEALDATLSALKEEKA